MPQYKFGENDVFHNVIKSYPKYSISMYHNISYINGNTFAETSRAGAHTAAVGYITVAGDPDADEEIIIVSSDGTSKAYVAKNSESLADNEFKRTGTDAEVATSIKDCIEHASGHAGKITVTRSGGALTLTQAVTGISGNKTIVSDLSNVTVSGFIGGTDRLHSKNVSSGQLSLYEMNIDRPTASLDGAADIGGLVRAEIYESENNQDIHFSIGGFANVTSKESYGEVDKNIFTSSYPLTSSIMREIVIASRDTDNDIDGYKLPSSLLQEIPTKQETIFKIIALKNIYDSYRPMSPYFDFDKYIFVSGGVPYERINTGDGNKTTTNIKLADSQKNAAGAALTESIPRSDYTNLIAIPKIFYGSGIKKGSVDLKFYYTGSLIGRAQDIYKNGLLVETTGSSASVATVIGTVLYNEGIMLITASHKLNDFVEDGYLSPKSGSVDSSKYGSGGMGALSASWVDNPRWSHFGAYESFLTASDDTVHFPANSVVGQQGRSSSSYAPASSSYILEFRGTSYTPVVTMLAHAPKNELNWSNNITYVDKSNLRFTDKVNEFIEPYEKTFVKQTSSVSYKENEKIIIKNTVSSSFSHYSASFKPQTFISKIGIYDEDKNLIAVAKLANPVKKTNEQDYTFKLKLDI